MLEDEPQRMPLPHRIPQYQSPPRPLRASSPRVIAQYLHSCFFHLEVRKGFELLTKDMWRRLLIEGERVVSARKVGSWRSVASQGEVVVQYRRGLRELVRRLREKGVVAVQRLRL